MKIYKWLNIGAVVCVLLGALAVEAAGSMSVAVVQMIWWFGMAAGMRGIAYVGQKHLDDVNYQAWKDSTKKQK